MRPLIKDATSKLRTVGAASADALKRVDLFRGMRNMQMQDDFFTYGGSELAPMSARIHTCL